MQSPENGHNKGIQKVKNLYCDFFAIWICHEQKKLSHKIETL
jgi:hypothetical protein